MEIIVGLGNPGEKFENTRHNVGFWVVDLLVEEAGWRWHAFKKHQTMESQPPKSEVLYVKPQTFMNESGKAVSAVKKEYGFKLEDLLLVHDDLDLEPGVWKLQRGRGSAGHNGVKSVIEELGMQDFWRLRVGVGKPNKAGEKYVLEEPSKEGRKLIQKAIADALPRVLEWASS